MSEQKGTEATGHKGPLKKPKELQTIDKGQG